MWVYLNLQTHTYFKKACIHFKHVIILEKNGNTQLLKIRQVLKYFYKQGCHHTTNIQYKTAFGKTNHFPFPLNQPHFKDGVVQWNLRLHGGGGRG